MAPEVARREALAARWRLAYARALDGERPDWRRGAPGEAAWRRGAAAGRRPRCESASVTRFGAWVSRGTPVGSHMSQSLWWSMGALAVVSQWAEAVKTCLAFGRR